MTLYDVHTVGEPVRHFQQYPDEALALRMRDHLSGVLHCELAVEPVELPDPVASPVEVGA